MAMYGQEPLVASLFLVTMTGAPSSFLLPVVRPLTYIGSSVQSQNAIQQSNYIHCEANAPEALLCLKEDG